MFNCYIWLDLPTVFDVVYMMDSCIYLGVLIYGRYSVHTGSLQESSVDSGGIGCVDEVGRELIADYIDSDRRPLWTCQRWYSSIRDHNT